MKKLFIIPAIALGGLMYNKADAQIGFNASVTYNQPAAANVPNVVYTTDGQVITIAGDDFYYMPDVGAYYDVTDQLYIYFNGYNWIASAYLPGAYADFDWRTCRRFEIRAYNPFFNDGFYRERYAGVRIANWNYREGRDFDHRGDYNRGFDRDDRGYDRRDDRTVNQVEVNRTRVIENRNQVVENRTFDRSAQPYRPEGGQFENRQTVQNNNRGFNQPVVNRTFDRPAQPQRPAGGQFENKAQSRPAVQNDNRGGEKFTQNRQQDRPNDRKMSKF